MGITLSLNLVKDTHMLLTVKMSLDPAVMDALLMDQELFTLILNVGIWQDYPTIFSMKSNYNILCCQQQCFYKMENENDDSFKFVSN